MSGEMGVLLCFRDQMENFKLLQNHVSVSLDLSRAHRMHSAAIKGYKGRQNVMEWETVLVWFWIWDGVLSQSIKNSYLRLQRKEAQHYLLLQQYSYTIWGALQRWEVLIFHPFIESIIYTCLMSVILWDQEHLDLPWELCNIFTQIM